MNASREDAKAAALELVADREGDAARARAALVEAIVAAREVGVSLRAIADVTGASPETVRKLAGEAKS